MITLYDIAQEIAIKRDETTEKHLAKYLLFGREAIKELNLHNTLNVKSIMLDIDSTNMSVELPKDYISYSKVGILVGGKILELDYDSRIYPQEKPINLCEDENIEPTNRFKRDCDYCLNGGINLPYNYSYSWYNIKYGQEFHTLYTIPAYYGAKFFREHNGYLYLDSTCPLEDTKIILEYKTIGIDEKQTVVPELYRGAVSSFIDWKFALYKSKPNVQLLEREYQRQYKNVLKLKRSSTLLEILRAVRSTKGQGVIKY
jgi:hypothetical protein